ncbi:gfo/Idh/MocA family oxidoreductase, partial [Candidatus Parcubacteria bacterium]
AKRLVGDGRESLVLGNLSVAHLRLGGRGSHQVWKHRKESSGGAVNEMLVHMIDLALWFFGKPERVQIIAHELLRPEREIQGERVRVDAEDYALVRLDYPGGFLVFCQADLVTPAFTQFVEIQGEHGSFMGSIQPDMPSFVFTQKAVGGYETGKNVLQFGPRNLFEAQMAEFVQAVRTRSNPDRNTIQDSVCLMEIMEKIKEEVNA